MYFLQQSGGVGGHGAGGVGTGVGQVGVPSGPSPAPPGPPHELGTQPLPPGSTPQIQQGSGESLQTLCPCIYRSKHQDCCHNTMFDGLDITLYLLYRFRDKCVAEEQGIKEYEMSSMRHQPPTLLI